MNYNDFKKTYKWMLKKYPETSNFYDRNDITIKMVVNRYYKSGSHWKLLETNTENINNENYLNIVDAVPFFKNLGGYEKIDAGYTKYGYIPKFLNSISPDRAEKITRQFIFD